VVSEGWGGICTSRRLAGELCFVGGGKFRKFGRGGGISCGVSIARGLLMSSSAIATVGAVYAFLPDLVAML
jgi:hypothetical protein